jgi:pantothenate kinase-related protein Tda10
MRPTIQVVIAGPQGSGKSKVKEVIIKKLRDLVNQGYRFEVSTTNEPVLAGNAEDTVVLS